MTDKPQKIKIRLIASGVVFERTVVARSRDNARHRVKKYPYAYLTGDDVVLADSIAANLAEVL